MIWLKITLEILVIFFALFMICFIPLVLKGPVCLVFFYPNEVRHRVVRLKLTTKGIIKRNKTIFRLTVVPFYLLAVIISVFVINGADNFLSAFLQMTFIATMVNLLDCIFIDEIWVRKTNMWVIKGTEDLKNKYVPLDLQIKKRVATEISILVVSAIVSFIASII